MIRADLGACFWVLGVALAALGSPEREEARDAHAASYISSTRFGSLKVEFRTLAPTNNARGITATVHAVLEDPPREAWIIHRILMDVRRSLYYGYDLELTKAAGAGQFVAVVRPMDATVEEDFRAREWRDLCRDCEAPSPVANASQRFPAPLTVAPGDTLALDLLADERSGELITEQVTFSSDLPVRRLGTAKALPSRDLEAEAVFFQLSEARLLVNGAEAEGIGGSGPVSLQGDVLWISTPGLGRVILSLVPRAAYDFKKIGVVSGDRIAFSIEGDRYEWVSKGPIVTPGPVPPFNQAQSWYVWVLHDPDFNPGDRRGAVGEGFDESARTRLRRR